MIEKIVVHECSYDENGTRRQDIEIYYSFVGKDVYKRQALRYFKSEVMEMCHREGLYQIDLLNGSKNRVTEIGRAHV